MFVWLMVKHPAVQKKAQEEIDGVIGRLPVQEDAKDLPYLQAVIQELHRLHVLLPMAAPHAASEDVEARLLSSCVSLSQVLTVSSSTATSFPREPSFCRISVSMRT